MHAQNNAAPAAAALEQYFDTPGWAHAPTVADLILERLPSGEHAYLRPDDDEPRYWITDAGRRALREAELFDEPRP